MACTILYSTRCKEYELVIEHLSRPRRKIINARDQKGYPVLHWAINDRLLLQATPQPRALALNTHDNENCTTFALGQRNQVTRLCVIFFYWKQGGMVDAVSYAGNTPLLTACVGFYRSNDQKRLEEYQLIIDHLVSITVANINARGQKGYSTLHWAIK